MREMILFFEGSSEEMEKKAADAIQAAVFKEMEKEGLVVRQFYNAGIEKKACINMNERLSKELKIPKFMLEIPAVKNSG